MYYGNANEQQNVVLSTLNYSNNNQESCWVKIDSTKIFELNLSKISNTFSDF